MSKELTIEHIAPYLPYGLNVSKLHTLHSGVGIGSIEHVLTTKNKAIKPILRPLSDLDTETLLKDLGRKSSDAIIDWCEYFDSDSENKNCAILCAPYPVIQYCFKNHFDVFSLIPLNLAIDINTLTNE